MVYFTEFIPKYQVLIPFFYKLSSIFYYLSKKNGKFKNYLAVFSSCIQSTILLA